MSEIAKTKKREKSGGRKKGTPNKTTAVLKSAIMESFDKVGGVEYLVQVAQEDPKSFLSLLGKLVPSEIKAELSTTDKVVVTVRDFTRTEHVVNAEEDGSEENEG
jgi:hypothetical protein